MRFHVIFFAPVPPGDAAMFGRDSRLVERRETVIVYADSPEAAEAAARQHYRAVHGRTPESRGYGQTRVEEAKP